jgi:hypothetical protein
MYLLDPIIGETWRKRLGAAVLVLNALLIVLQVAAEQLQGLPSWPWVASASAALTAAVVGLTHLTAIGNKVFQPKVGD